MRKKKNKCRKGEPGFSLPEVMFAVGILAFGILAVASMQQSALLGTSRSTSVTQATNIIMDRMERLLSLPFSTWAVGVGAGVITTGDDSFFTNPPTNPSITSVTFEVRRGPTFDADNNNTSVTIIVTVQTRELQQPVTLTGVKNSV